MKYIKKILILAIVSLALLPFGAMAAQSSSNTTWQSYKNGVLTVYSGSNDRGTVLYRGDPNSYKKNTVNNVVDSSVRLNVKSNIYKTTYQVYSGNTLTVHSNVNKDSSITFKGTPKDYKKKLVQ